MPTIETIPVWTVLPDWATEVISRYAWRTSVVESPTQAEQRRALRIGPRVTLSFTYALVDRERAFLDLMLSTNISGDWYFPLAYEIGRLSAALPPGSTSIPFARAHREFNVPGFGLLVGDDFTRYEVISLNTADVTQFNITATVGQWPAGTRLFPLRKGRLAGNARVSRRTQRAAVAQVDFFVTDNLAWGGMAALTEYASYPVWDYLPDESEAIDVSFDRLAYEIDNDSGVTARLDLTGIARTVQGFRWFLRGREQHASFLDLLHFLRGRLTPFWVSTFSRDFRIVAPVADGGVTAVCEYSGLSRLGGPIEGRRHIEIRLANGTVYRRRIETCVANADGTETLTLNAAMSTGFDAAAVARVSFLRLARLDQDEIEIAHITDSAGVARSATVLRSVRENRNAADWTPPPLDDVELIDAACGVEGAPLLYIGNANGLFDFGRATVEAFTPPTGSPPTPSTATQIKKLSFLNGGTVLGMTVAHRKIYHAASAGSTIFTFDADTGVVITGVNPGLGALRRLAYDGRYIFAGYNAAPQNIARLTRSLSLVSTITFPLTTLFAGGQIDAICVFNGMVVLSRRAIGAGANATKFHLYRIDGTLVYANFINASGLHVGLTYDGTWIYSSNPINGRVYRWDPATGLAAGDFALANPFSTTRAPIALAFAYE